MEIKSNFLECFKLPKSRSRLVVGIQSVASQSTFLVLGSSTDYSENIQSDEDEREAALSQFPLSFWHIFVDLKCDSIDFTFVSR